MKLLLMIIFATIGILTAINKEKKKINIPDKLSDIITVSCVFIEGIILMFYK